MPDGQTHKADEDLEQILAEIAQTGPIDTNLVIAAMKALGHENITPEQITLGYTRLEQKITNLANPTPTPGIKRDQVHCQRCRYTFPIYVHTIPPGYPLEGEHAWNVTKAIKIVQSRPREQRLVPKATIRKIIESNGPDGIITAHLDHVDPAFPGIAVPFPIDPTTMVMIIIDGNHRAARCIRDGLDFYIYYLDHNESEACKIWSPTKPITAQNLATQGLGIQIL